MIKRYSKDEMSKIWELESKFSYYLKVEMAVVEAYYRLGQIPKEAYEHILKTAKFTVPEIEKIENTVNHDVIAFLTCVNNYVGEKYSGYIHKGLTSSDVIDTAFALQVKDSADIILKDLDTLLKTLKTLAVKYKDTMCIGRSHGIGAEVITFGFKLLNWYDMFERAKYRLKYALSDMLRGQISGPVGTYSNIEPEIERVTCEILGLKPAKISTQVIARDVHAAYIQALSLIGCAIENVAVEIRHLQRWEVAEVEEGFKKGQKGSSAMPHKKNPISGENLSGLSRILRANSLAALENIALWHERDISHSSVERVIFPDSNILADYMLQRLNSTLENLVVKPDNMLKNIGKYGDIIFSQSCLLKLTDKGMTREAAYEIVQNEAMAAFNGVSHKENFKENMRSHLKSTEIEECFNYQKYLRNIDKIFERFE